MKPDHARRFTPDSGRHRAAHLAGRKSFFQRLLERLRPQRQELGGDSQSNYGTSDDPGR
jgi:hypothetical protein